MSTTSATVTAVTAIPSSASATDAAPVPGAAAAQHAFEQSKLTRREWEGLEVPLHAEEVAVLRMITAGWDNSDVCTNPRQSILSVTKLWSLATANDIIYKRFLAKRVSALAASIKHLHAPETQTGSKSKKPKPTSAADTIRLANTNFETLKTRTDIWDFALLGYAEALAEDPTPTHYYTLARALEAKVDGTNEHLLGFVTRLINICKKHVSVSDMIEHIEDATELNPLLQTFANRRLYQHQRDLIAALHRPQPKLILYQAPTGTGKTLSPVAVSEGYKVIFVCASKHVGMQLARACISIQKRIAVAFGCRDAGDIRLHYYAVSECTRKRRSGAIGKIDHSQGQKVDLIIADATSYLPAMHYMVSFNPKESLLVYWDEPTIAMDKPADELHEIVRKSWRENIIPNIVLSSATLPPPSDLPRFIDSVQTKFGIADDDVITISNYECARTVPLLLKSGHVAMPHGVATSMENLEAMSTQCSERATLLRHIDLGAAARYLLAANRVVQHTDLLAEFRSIGDVTPESVKRSYLACLLLVAEAIGLEEAGRLAPEPPRFTGGVRLGTGDAASITHGPVLYLAVNTEKVAKYLIRDADPAADIIDGLQEQAHINSQVMKQIERLEKDLADRQDGKDGKDGKEHPDDDKGGIVDGKANAITNKLHKIRQRLTELRLPEREVPNTDEHQHRFHRELRSDAFLGSVPPHHLEEVLGLEVDNWKKMLLMMGIGVFGEQCPTYRELMSRMASQRELFCVIAGTDYVYGTNYQFCHGYIGRDLADMPVEKLYQALGRVGRGRHAGQYSWRLRDDSLALRVFSPDARLTEARRMDKLMSGT